MTIKEYINLYLWNKVDFDKVYWYQCCDLVKDFAKKVLDAPLGGCNWSAKNLIDRNIAWYTKTMNTPFDIPKSWSIIVWKWWPYEQYGHTAVCIYADDKNLTVLEQNAGWTGDGEWKNAIRLHKYNYDYIAGWFTKKEIFYEQVMELSEGQVVAVYKWKHYINHKNKKVLITPFNIEKYVI